MNGLSCVLMLLLPVVIIAGDEIISDNFDTTDKNEPEITTENEG